MRSMVCFHPQCNRGPATTGHAIYRVNAKGQPGIWACEKHRALTDAPRDPELDRVVTVIEGAGHLTESGR
jgi:hypothetical protein